MTEYPLIKKERKKMDFPIIESARNTINWIVENPLRAITLGIIITSAGLGITGAGIYLEQRRREMF